MAPATGIETLNQAFGVKRAFIAELFVAPPHAVAMEFDFLGERRSGHWLIGGG
jgi:hypothetical protein